MQKVAQKVANFWDQLNLFNKSQRAFNSSPISEKITQSGHTGQRKTVFNIDCSMPLRTLWSSSFTVTPTVRLNPRQGSLDRGVRKLMCLGQVFNYKFGCFDGAHGLT
jgi:hypothetical protein